MRKLLLLGLILLVAIPVFAQGPAFQVTSLPRQLRGEGQAETLGEIFLLATNGSATTTITTGSSINIVYSAPVATSGGTAAAPTPIPPKLSCTVGGVVLAACPVTIIPVSTGNQLSISFTAGFTLTNVGDGIEISQVRADATGVGTAPITATLSGVSANPATNPITFTQALVTVGITSKPSSTGTIINKGTLLTCGAQAATFVAANSVTIDLVEAYPAAWTSQADETSFASTVATSQGARVQFRFSGIPAGVTVTGRFLCAGVVVGSAGCIAAITPDAQGRATKSSATLGVKNATPAAVTQAAGSSGSTITITFEFDKDSLSGVETGSFEFTFTYAALPPGGLTGNIGVKVRYGPVDTASPPTNIPRFADVPFLSDNAAVLGDCITGLLFPFVVANVANFDTSIAIANASNDKTAFGGTARAVPQDGTCTLTAYPSDLATATPGATNPQFTTPKIVNGATYATALSAIAAFNPFAGHMYAICNFLNGHGLAIVTDNFSLGPPRIAHGYSPLVLPTTRVVPGGESLGQ